MDRRADAGGFPVCLILAAILLGGKMLSDPQWGPSEKTMGVSDTSFAALQ